MTRTTVIVKSEPYSDESAFTGLKFARTALNEGHSIEVFLVQGGVFCALYGQNPDQMTNHYELISDIIELGGRVVCCGTCTKSRGIGKDLLHPNVEIGTMSILIGMVSTSDQVITF